jgi:hypothetical protein
MQPHNTSLCLQTPRAFVGQLHNLQKLLEFNHGWTPADKGIAQLDYADDQEDRRVREQVAQVGSGNMDRSDEIEVCTPWVTQVWVNGGQAINYCQVNSVRALNSRWVNSGQATYCCQVNSVQALKNSRRTNSGQALNYSPTNSGQIYSCIDFRIMLTGLYTAWLLLLVLMPSHRGYKHFEARFHLATRSESKALVSAIVSEAQMALEANAPLNLHAPLPPVSDHGPCCRTICWPACYRGTACCLLNPQRGASDGDGRARRCSRGRALPGCYVCVTPQDSTGRPASGTVATQGEGWA